MFCVFAATLPAAVCPQLAWAAPTITLHIDASEAPLRIIRVKESIRLEAGQNTLVYPKWLPGEHGPTGPINDVVDVRFEAKGKTIAWQRDPLDMFAFHLAPGVEAREVTATLSFVTGTGARGAPSPPSASAQVLIIKANHFVLYPQGAKPANLEVSTSVKFPLGWRFASALGTEKTTNATTLFATTSLETFIDSPILAGAYTQSWDLTPAGGPSHRLFAAADSLEALQLKPETLAGYRKLVTESYALFGVRPYRRYTFLVALSNHVPHGGLEHFESSDNRMFEDTWTDEGHLLFRSSLLSHEMAHVWNGKLRRPSGLATADYQQAYDTRLLWIYEGLTTYLGDVLAARAGLRSVSDARDLLAISAAGMDATTGRTWRSIGDTATASQIMSPAVRGWRGARRGLDYYPEMYLVWLQVDATIRQLSHDAKSLDDFCKLFYGGSDGKATMIPYERSDVIAALNQVAPYDWDAFFAARVDGLVANASAEPLRALGWKLVFTREPNKTFRAVESATKETNLLFSLGLAVTEDGNVTDVLAGSAAARAGLSPAMQIEAVNGRRFTTGRLRTAVEESVSRGFVELIVENDEFFATKKLVWRQGHRYPTLQREATAPDRLTAILGPLQN